jgi:ribosomal protein S4
MFCQLRNLLKNKSHYFKALKKKKKKSDFSKQLQNIQKLSFFYEKLTSKKNAKILNANLSR